MPRIPQRLTLEDIQQAFRDVGKDLDPLLTTNVDLQGRRLQGAGKAIAPRDYVTLQDVKDLLKGSKQVSTGQSKTPVVVAAGSGGGASSSLPPPNHPMDFGYYFVDSKYGQLSNEVKSYTNLAYIGPNNMLDTTASLADVKAAVGAGMGRLVAAGLSIILDMEGGGLLTLGGTLEAATPYWAKVKYIVFKGDIDRGRDAMQAAVTSLKSGIAGLGLPSRPVGVVLDGTTFPGDGHLADALDFVAVEAYPENFASHGTSNDNINAVRAIVSSLKNQIPGGKRVGVIMAGYTKSGLFSPISPDLIDLQSATYLMCNTDTRVDFLLVFSYGRPSGTKENQALKPIHQQIGALCTGTAGGSSGGGGGDGGGGTGTGGATCGGAGLSSNCKRYCVGGTWDYNLNVVQRDSVQAHPEWFVDPSFSIPTFVDSASMNAYMVDVTARLNAMPGIHAAIGTTDFGQLWIQAASNPDYSDGYAIVTSQLQVRFNPGAYRATCTPAQV